MHQHPLAFTPIGRRNGDITPLQSAEALDSALNLDVAEHIDYEK
tara:strand:+ start:57 stop:188 length:132 start_codon:yes stop_codon:yes gene_type:complete